MPPRTKMLRDGPIGREEALGMARRLKPLHTPLALTRGLMRVFYTVVQIAMLAMFDSRENLSLRRSVALEFVGDEHARHVRQPFEELAEELLRCPLVTSALHPDVEHVPLLIHRPPHIVPFTFNGEYPLVEVPLVAGPRTAATELIRILLSEFAAPFANRFRAHDYTAFKQEFFNIAEAQAEPKVQPHGVADDLDRETMVLVSGGRC
jgi:hypothetical protein